MNPTETFPHRRARDERYRHYCACGDSVPEEMFKGVGSPLSPSYTWGSDCPAALREALAWQEDRHGTRAEQEREEADLAAEMAAVEAMSDDEINASLDAAGVDRALADRKCDALVRVCVERLALVMKLEKAEKERDAALARVAELERATPGPHIPPALMRRVEALGFVPGSGEPVEWLIRDHLRLRQALNDAEAAHGATIAERDELAARVDELAGRVMVAENPQEAPRD